MSFSQLLISAKNNDYIARKELFEMYSPLLIKWALCDEGFDEDLYQELQVVFLKALKSFKL